MKGLGIGFDTRAHVVKFDMLVYVSDYIDLTCEREYDCVPHFQRMGEDKGIWRTFPL